MPRTYNAAREAGRARPNRTDLIGASPLPNIEAPSQQYGQRAEQQAAQRALPMAPTPVAPGPAPQAQGQPQPPPTLQSMLAAAQAHNGPGTSLKLNRPTERPDEPGTTGLPIGPGAGPQALTGVGAIAREGVIEQGTLSHLLQNMAAQPNATDAVRDLASRAMAGAR